MVMKEVTGWRLCRTAGGGAIAAAGAPGAKRACPQLTDPPPALAAARNQANTAPLLSEVQEVHTEAI